MAKANIMVLLQQYVMTKMVLLIVFLCEIYLVSFFAWFQYLPTEFTRKSFSLFPVCLRIFLKCPSCVGGEDDEFPLANIHNDANCFVVRFCTLYNFQAGKLSSFKIFQLKIQVTHLCFTNFPPSFRKKTLVKKLNNGKEKKRIDR